MNYNVKTHNRERFAEFIRGNSVAIVGRAEYLNELEQGEYIDSHDVVIRAHSNLPYPSPKWHLAFDDAHSFVPASHQGRLGANTDAFAPSNLPFWSLQEIDEIVPKLTDRGCKWLIQHKIYNVPEVTDHPGKRVELSVIDYISDKYLPVFVAPPDVFDQLMRELDYCFPMPGTVLIKELSLLNPSRLYVTGFSCYMDNKERWLSAEVSLTRNHKPLYDLRFLRDLTRQGHIETDDIMTEYFKEI